MRGGALLLLLGAGGCSFAETREDWSAGLGPVGPCYEANLLDGLDTTSTAEAHAVFACLNASGALDAYAPLDAALDADARDGPVGLVLARWIADLPLADLSLAEVVDAARAVLEDPSALFAVAELAFELVYGAPWPWLGVSVALDDADALAGGLLSPGLEVGATVATATLDEDLAPLAPLAAALRAEETKRLAWTLASIGASADPTLAALDARWAGDLADALDRADDGRNDRWAAASGHSVRDLAAALLSAEDDGRTTLNHAAVAAEPLLADTRLRDALARVLADQLDAGRVDALPAQLVYLVSVDANGGDLAGGEDSALVALLRLLHDANAPVDCTVDLGLVDLDFSLGNLSVELLQLLARQDPETVDGGVGLLGDLLGFPLTDAILDAVADSGVCPVIDDELVGDLHAVDRLSDPETDELLYVLLHVLAATDDQGQVPELVELLSEVHGRGLVPPMEEVVRDLGDTAIARDLVAALPVLVEPLAHHDAAYFPAGLPPLDFSTIWDTAAALLAPDGAGRTSLAPLEGPLRALVSEDATWELAARFATLAALDDAHAARLLDRLDEACHADPALATLDDAADALEEPTLVRPALVLLEAPPLHAAILTTAPDAEGPIPFSARLVQGGTVQVLLDTVRLFASLLPEEHE